MTWTVIGFEFRTRTLVSPFPFHIAIKLLFSLTSLQGNSVLTSPAQGHERSSKRRYRSFEWALGATICGRRWSFRSWLCQWQFCSAFKRPRERWEHGRHHSAAWDHSYDYSGKRIGVIGNGSSGIQMLPAMAKLPNTQVTSLQRGPTWIFSRMTPADLVGSSDKSYNHVYREEDEQRFQDPEEMKGYRKKAQGGVNKAYHMLVKGSPANMSATIFAEKQMSEKLNHDPVLCEKLIPKWELGCRRITPGDGYLESSTQPNVNLTNSPITSIEATGIRTAGNTLHELDVIIFPTGFDVSQIPPYPVIGLNNMTLAEKWNQEPESYLSVACPEFPNYSIFTGPNATVTGPSFKVYHGQVIILSFGSSKCPERISLPLSLNKRLLTNLFGMEIRCIRR
ncbi:putative sterigmatocystin biosynthesis monooxygenase stcW like protein [Venturia nashicola]|uniref:Putative sterigmatocystin biosynthesis monooxygenase stcW like protein n=1 Tax=Venturia nashicola TaxID=86259 RepID=A0A4Z1P1E2_9PEZI|nr:putative sterigmatocystin biosynthesis monooxygenase stcW like protein [Venturia nashicola]TLD18726.1 putative sterigmatocystin biosynthesis monooxygenase stcW like protein [Venturia nashicola]